MQRFFRGMRLSQKIVLPLLAVCLSIFLLGLVVIGQWFTDSLNQNFRQQIESFTERVDQDFQYEKQTLETEIELIANRDMLNQAVEQRNQGLLLQILLPLKSILKLDWIKVIDTQGNVLVDLRNNSLSQTKFLDKVITNTASKGAHLVDLVDVEGQQQVLQVVTNGIKSSAGLLGGILIGNLVDDTLLQKIAAGSSKHLIIHRQNRIVAATLLTTKGKNWQLPPPNLPATLITLDNKNYLAKSIVFTGASQSFTTTVLYSISMLEVAQYKLWEHLGLLFLLGSSILGVVGFLIARTITHHLKAVTYVAQRVTQESNFNLQAPVTSEDEVGILAISFNQLIQQVKRLLAEQYEANQKLEVYSQTLEEKIEERTQALRQKNIDLKHTLQELRRTQSQLIQNEKMSSLGHLVAGIAHEINNPVNFIYGNLKHTDDYTQQLLWLLELYQKHYPYPEPEIQNAKQEADIEYLTEDLPKILSSMKIGANRIREIVLSLRIFSRLDEAEFKNADIHEGIDSTLLILQHRLKSQSARPKITVVKEYSEIPKIQCFAGQLNQVFMNILANAIDALEEAFQNGFCPDPIIRISSAQVNENVVIQIVDNGIGIPEAIQSHIFDPFFTTKPVGKGTGMGLSISYQIITEKHGGYLRCISSPGQGTEFVIAIPIRGT
ncbi:MAG: ATP-binding protein [Nostoc sp. ZfuVER08]|uniref:histidine kinase n=1 Tax=Nostoc punctiforme FACHB-252 TaxID=1357509 RepID=A0ABR8HC70_NOSPU|nr:ATP-binding protein [Nostoc punctiforme]MBD2613339.1 HAMP domain-containing protein [Nostoc punctiforme FACHB-252]MBL1199268.1 HAMP domain-containing protein [Nostoc sp. GBBB01]MDZ8011316.1 ATP-binding protein [Nostoc sp. ZfuVER08]